MALVLRPLERQDIDHVVDLSLRAWAPVHASMARVLGESINSLVYPDWAAAQEDAVRRACWDADTRVTVAVEGATVLGFVTVVIHRDRNAGELGMIAVEPAAQQHGVARTLTEGALAQMRHAGCTYAEVATGGDPGHAPARALYESAGFTALPLVRYYLKL